MGRERRERMTEGERSPHSSQRVSDQDQLPPGGIMIMIDCGQSDQLIRQQVEGEGGGGLRENQSVAAQAPAAPSRCGSVVVPVPAAVRCLPSALCPLPSSLLLLSPSPISTPTTTTASPIQFYAATLSAREPLHTVSNLPLYYFPAHCTPPPPPLVALFLLQFPSKMAFSSSFCPVCSLTRPRRRCRRRHRQRCSVTNR